MRSRAAREGRTPPPVPSPPGLKLTYSIRGTNSSTLGQKGPETDLGRCFRRAAGGVARKCPARVKNRLWILLKVVASTLGAGVGLPQYITAVGDCSGRSIRVQSLHQVD